MSPFSKLSKRQLYFYFVHTKRQYDSWKKMTHPNEHFLTKLLSLNPSNLEILIITTYELFLKPFWLRMKTVRFKLIYLQINEMCMYYYGCTDITLKRFYYKTTIFSLNCVLTQKILRFKSSL